MLRVRRLLDEEDRGRQLRDLSRIHPLRFVEDIGLGALEAQRNGAPGGFRARPGPVGDRWISFRSCTVWQFQTRPRHAHDPRTYFNPSVNGSSSTFNKSKP